MSRLRLSYTKQGGSRLNLTNENRAILVKIAVPSEGVTKTLLINTTALISDLRSKLMMKLNMNGPASMAWGEGYAFFWSKEADQLWLDEKTSLRAYAFKDGELIEFRQRPRDWKPIIHPKNIGPWVKAAPKQEAQHAHQKDKQQPQPKEENPFAFSGEEGSNVLYQEQREEEIMQEAHKEADKHTTYPQAPPSAPTPATTPSTAPAVEKKETFDTFDEILESLTLSEQLIRSKSTERVGSFGAKRRSRMTASMDLNEVRNSTIEQLQSTIEGYETKLASINDMLWTIVRGIENHAIDAKTIHRLAKRGIKTCTITTDNK